MAAYHNPGEQDEAEVPETAEAPSTRSVRKTLLIAAGIICVVLATVGIFVPILPTTPFLLLAAAAFTRSSDRLYRWLINHRWFGTYIRNYREHRAVTLRTKIVAVAMLWATIGFTVITVVENWLVRGLLVAIASGVSLHLVRLKTLTREMMEEQPQE